MKNESFDKIADELGTTFVGEQIDVIKEAIDKKNKLVKRVNSDVEICLQDSEYIKTEIISTIAILEIGLDQLVQDIKTGSPPRMFEVLGHLANSKMTAVRELKELNKTISDIRFRDKKGSPESPQQGNHFTFNMTSTDLQDMISKAKESSTLKDIDENFIVE